VEPSAREQASRNPDPSLYRRVLIPVNWANPVEPIVRAFLDRVTGTDAQIIALQLLPEWCSPEIEITTRVRLRRVAERLPLPSERIVTEVKFGDPVDVVLATAAVRRVDLIAIMTDPPGTVDRFLGHGVVAELVRRSPARVYLMTPPAGEGRAA
jgi:nucleotide-binding universal stress UspA family protein